MRYSKEHKLETHARIVKKASVRLREKGAHGVGVADLNEEAGLTMAVLRPLSIRGKRW